MPTAQLIYRGEDFQFVDGRVRYEGSCAWSWEDVPGEGPRCTGPVYIDASSIRRTGFARLMPLGKAKKLAIARCARELLTANGSTVEFLVVEDIPATSDASK